MSFDGKCFCLISGASSGFGRAISQLITKENNILRNAAAGSIILLISRNADELMVTRELILQNEFAVDKFSVCILPIDLANTNQTEIELKRFLDEVSVDFDHVLIFNNAGSVGDISKTLQQSDWNIDYFQRFTNLSIVSPMFIINLFCKYFSKSKRIVIQTSSLCAIQPFRYMPLYCSGKASMDMFTKCLTLDHPDIITLNYAPGPLETPMGVQMKEKNGCSEIRSSFSEMFEKGTIIKPIDSAEKLLNLLLEMKFESGSHIDYYDI